MALDIIAGVFVVWGLIRGWLRGLLFQLGQIGMLAIAFVASRALADVVEPWLGEFFDAGPMVRTSVAFFVVFLAVYTVGVMIVRAFTRDLREVSDTLSAGDRTLGALAGAAKGVLVAYLLLIGLIMTNQMTGKLPIPYASSFSGRFAMKHNFLESERFPRARALLQLGWLLSTHGTTELVTNPHFTAILEHPKADVLRSPEVARALAAGEWMTVVGNEAVWDLLDESEIQEHLNAIEAQDLNRAGGDGADSESPAEPPGGAQPGPLFSPTPQPTSTVPR